jgi:hypothetical protein
MGTHIIGTFIGVTVKKLRKQYLPTSPELEIREYKKNKINFRNSYYKKLYV